MMMCDTEAVDNAGFGLTIMQPANRLLVDGSAELCCFLIVLILRPLRRPLRRQRPGWHAAAADVVKFVETARPGGEAGLRLNASAPAVWQFVSDVQRNAFGQPRGYAVAFTGETITNKWFPMTVLQTSQYPFAKFSLQ